MTQITDELHYDESPVLGTSLADFSQVMFAGYHQRQFGLTLEEHLEQSGMTLPSLLRNLWLAHDLDGELLLSVAGVLVFGNDPQRFLPQSRVSAVAFAGTDEDANPEFPATQGYF